MAATKGWAGSPRPAAWGGWAPVLRCLSVGLLLRAAPGSSAPSQPEVLVPVDLSGRVRVLSGATARDLGLFGGVAGLQEVRLYRLPDGRFALELSCRTDSTEVKHRQLLEAEEATALRARVSSLVAERAPGTLVERSGRTRFLVRTFLLSYGYYSWALPVALDLDGRAAGATGLATGGAGFFLPYYLSRGQPIGASGAIAGAHLGTAGIAHGILLSELAPGKPTYRRNLASGMAVSAAGLWAGVLWADRAGLTPGAADLTCWSGNWGLAMGGGVANLAGWIDEGDRQLAAAACLVGSGVGHLCGLHLARRVPHSSGDVEAAVTTTVLGAGNAVALTNLTGTEDERAYTAAAMAGSAAGALLGELRSAGLGLSTDQARLALLGAGGGALLGMAAAVLVSPAAERAAPLLVAAGADGGFWLMQRGLVARRSPTGAGHWFSVAPQLLAGRSEAGRTRAVAGLRACWLFR